MLQGLSGKQWADARFGEKKETPPKVYVCGSCRDPFVKSVKFDLMVRIKEKHYVMFLDPVRHPNEREDHAGIAAVNLNDIASCDLMIVITNDHIGPGTAIEMYIANAVHGKDVILFTNVKYNDITPHIRCIVDHQLYSLSCATEVTDSWLTEWKREGV